MSRLTIVFAVCTLAPVEAEVRDYSGTERQRREYGAHRKARSRVPLLLGAQVARALQVTPLGDADERVRERRLEHQEAPGRRPHESYRTCTHLQSNVNLKCKPTHQSETDVVS